MEEITDMHKTLNVAVLGPLGTYTHEAAHSRFGSEVIYQDRQTITDTINSLSDTIPIAVVPQENSIFGSVIETYDNFRRSECGFVQGEVLLKVKHCIVVKKGVTLGEIRRVMSHEQALGQCRVFLDTYLPGVEQVKMPSTAAAARALLDGPPSQAAICSKLCASMFNGLDVLREGIQTGDVNYTRFLIMTRNRGNTIPRQLSVTACYKAICRIPVRSLASDLMHIFKLIDAGMKIVRIDRRPDVRATAPFQDVYFIEVMRAPPTSSIDLATWAAEVDTLVLTIKQACEDVDMGALHETMTTANPLAGPSPLRDVINPQFHQINFSVEPYIKNDLGVKLDKDDQICRLSLTAAGCPLGPLHCPLRHTTPSVQNFQPPKQLPTHPRERERLATVCKHWLRGLCKKGDACEFLHEYNLRRMPECWWFAKYGYCSAGDECLYAHPKERRVECPDYNRGFCKLGPDCPRKHVRKVACQLYLTGFCPLGPDCTRGHPKPDLPPPKAYEPPPPPSTRDLGPPPPGYGRYADFDRGSSLANASANPLGSARRNLDEVMCFKCGEKGHYANHCRNRNVPGNRGGTDRSARRYED